MLEILKNHDLYYGDIIDVIENANKINGNKESLRITGLIFGEKYSDIVKICAEELDLFAKFGFEVMVKKMDDNIHIKYICES